MIAYEKWLLALSDPENPCRHPPRQKLSLEEISALCFHAELHGILPIVLKKLDYYLRQEPATLLSSRDSSSAVIAAMQPLQKRLAEKAAITLFLEAESRRLLSQFHLEGAVAILLKGSDFAKRLYAPPALRSYGDIDFLVRGSDWDAVRAIMQRLGYVTKEEPMKHAGGYSEQVWEHPTMAGANVEIHNDLVNSPTIRRGVSVKFEDLPLAAGPDGRLRATPAGLLVIAAVHAATSHGFDRLQHVCDIAQIVRGRSGLINESSLRECLSRTSAGFSVALGLDLVERLFAEPAATELLKSLKFHWPRRLTRRLITAPMIARSQGVRRPATSWRRQILRQMLKTRR